MMLVDSDPEESLASLSRMLGRNSAYLQQYVTRGSPRSLSERDRALLARYFTIDEALLGGPTREPHASVRVPILDARAAGGAGGIVEDDVVVAEVEWDAGLLRQLGVRGRALSMVAATGTSMEPTIRDGDTMLVDTADRAVPAAGALFVLRLEGALLVKRVRRKGRALLITSDNPEAPAVGTRDDAELIGRVLWLGRVLR